MILPWQKRLKKDESTNASFSLDEKDMKILRVLQQNARATVKEISQTKCISAPRRFMKGSNAWKRGRDQAIRHAGRSFQSKKGLDGDLLCIAQTTQPQNAGVPNSSKAF
jgi:hypothetical protein